MKRVLFTFLALTLAPLSIAADSKPAEAWYGPYYRPAPVYGPVVPAYRLYRRPPVYRPAPVYVAPTVVRPVPVYVERETVVIEREPVYIEREPVVVREPAPAPTVMRQAEPTRDLIAIGLHGSAVGMAGDKVGLSTAENPAMAGIGLHVKGRFAESWGLELSLDFLSGSASDADFRQSTVPLMAALTWHILPNSRVQPYLLAGAGVHFTRLAYFGQHAAPSFGGDYNIDVTEFAGQLGGGVEFFLTENIALNADLRFNTVFRNMDTRHSVHTDCLRRAGSATGFCDNIHYTGEEDKVNLGAQFRIGASWYF